MKSRLTNPGEVAVHACPQFMTIPKTSAFGALAIAMLPVMALAADPEDRGLSIRDMLISTLPIVIVLVLILIFFPLFFRRLRKHTGVERYELHWQKVETELKRIADALEKRDKDDHAG
jgi:hypothetical protein